MSLADKPVHPSEVKYLVASPLGNFNEEKTFKDNGMTLRQFYAGLAMQGILYSDKWGSINELSETSVNMADALIKQLEKTDES